MIKRQQKNIFYFLLSSFVILFFAVFISNKIQNQGIDKKKIKKISGVFHSKQKVLSSIEEEIFRSYDTDTLTKINKNLINLKKTCDDNGIILFVFKGDSLVGWTNNSVCLENVFWNGNTKNKIIELKNGYYYLDSKQKGKYNLSGLILIKNNYSLTNNYLENKFQKDFNISDNVKICLEKKDFNIYSENGAFLFSLIQDEDDVILNNKQYEILILLYSLFLIAFLLFLVFIYESISKLFSRRFLYFLFFIADLFIIRLIIYYFKLPAILYNTFLFKHLSETGIMFFNSMGDIFINSLIILILSFFLYRNISQKQNKNNSKKIIDYLKCGFIFLLIGALYFFIIYIQKILIYQADLSLLFSSFFGISINNFIFLFFIASFYTFFIFISDLLFSSFSKVYFKLCDYIFIILFLLTIFYFVEQRLFNRIELEFLFFFIIVFIIWFYKKIRLSEYFSITRVLVYILFFSFLSTYLLITVSDSKEKENRKNLALELINARDSKFETYFYNTENQIFSDAEIINLIDAEIVDNSYESKLSELILKRYFKNYTSKYNFQITVCSDLRNLEIQPGNNVVNCNEYFNEIIENYGRKTISKNLNFIDDGFYNINYLGKLKFNINDNGTIISIFIEASLKDISVGIGYPELLVNKLSDNYIDFSEYSYAIYKDNELIKSVGKYLYYLSFKENTTKSYKKSFFNFNKYNHLIYEPEENVKVIISKKNRSLLYLAAPFSYNLIFFSLFFILLLLIIHPSFDFFRIKVSFRNRLQFWIITIILSSFIIVCISTILYVEKFNSNKNVDALSEKTHSILIEVQHKMHDVDELLPEQQDYVYSLLLKFSNVFFSDINIYNLNGELYSSSRPEIFKKGFVSKQMNIIAFNELNENKKNLFIHKEKIGNYEFLSAYMSFRNDDNKLVAYLNLPYFVKQDDYKKEISAFIITYISFYLILIVLAIYITLIISGYITRPLINLKQKISQIKLGKRNEKIKWKRQDEIGGLINEYNRMIEELSESAELLAKTEREIAWREMAKQVAHEIKNPLTPMKLSVQYLNKSWDEGVDGWEEKFKIFSKTIVEQIDSLSDIASSFSDFAKMPKAKNEKIELSSIIKSAIDLYKDYQNIKFSFDYLHDKDYNIFADKKQMLRVFNNLISNSIHAIGNNNKGKIDFILQEKNKKYLIKIIDNGSGISKDKLNKIFIPNFTTKSGGMGLGLAMVKNIIISAQGDIWFESEENKGSCFYISLAVYNF